MAATPSRRFLIAAVLALAAAPALAQTPDAAPAPTPTPTPTPTPMGTDLGRIVKVDMLTDQGLIVFDLYPDKAPITVANFLRYVKEKRYNGTTIYRAVRTKGAEDTGFIQGGTQNDYKRTLPPIKLEPTTQTGLTHKDGTITMARLLPNSATSDFVIMIGGAPYMDANPSASGDNLGYAAFGRVAQGMDVVRKIQTLPAGGHARNPSMAGQILDPPVKIISAKVES